MRKALGRRGRGAKPGDMQVGATSHPPGRLWSEAHISAGEDAETSGHSPARSCLEHTRRGPAETVWKSPESSKWSCPVSGRCRPYAGTQEKRGHVHATPSGTFTAGLLTMLKGRTASDGHVERLNTP